MQCGGSDNLNPATKELLEVNDETRREERAADRPHVDEQIDIAVWPGLPAGDRAEKADVLCPMLPRKAQDILALGPDLLLDRHDGTYPFRFYLKYNCLGSP